VPNEDVWNRALTGGKIDTQAIKPQLVTDYCSYNAYTGGDPLHIGPLNDDVYWVGDLTFDCEVDVQSKSGELLLELVEGVRRYHCSFDLETGQATLSFLDDSLNPGDAERTELATVKTSVKGPGTYELCFANVDSRLCLWVDDDLVDLGIKGDYAAAMFPGPQRRDLSPVGVAVQNAHVKVSHLAIRRDVYYRAESIPEDGFSRDEEFGRSTHYLAELLHDPEEWSKEYESNHQIAKFGKLGDDEYFMLGDNSPRSQDSRLWPNNRGAARRHAVPRTALVGKAFFVYWPHGVPFLNGGKGFPVSYHSTPAGKKTKYPANSIPFRPNVERMHRIR
jgi:signal peptidase I